MLEPFALPRLAAAAEQAIGAPLPLKSSNKSGVPLALNSPRMVTTPVGGDTAVWLVAAKRGAVARAARTVRMAVANRLRWMGGVCICVRSTRFSVPQEQAKAWTTCEGVRSTHFSVLFPRPKSRLKPELRAGAYVVHALACSSHAPRAG